MYIQFGQLMCDNKLSRILKVEEEDEEEVLTALFVAQQNQKEFSTTFDFE